VTTAVAIDGRVESTTHETVRMVENGSGGFTRMTAPEYEFRKMHLYLIAADGDEAANTVTYYYGKGGRE